MSLKDYVPPEIAEQEPMKSCYETLDVELGSISSELNDILLNQFVDTATSWGLAKWEELIGIIVDETKSNEVRRGNIKSKLAESRPATKSQLVTIALNYGAVSASVSENNTGFEFTITFREDNIATEFPFAEFTNAIKNSKPAHLNDKYTRQRLLTTNNVRFTITVSAFTHTYQTCGGGKVCSSTFII